MRRILVGALVGAGLLNMSAGALAQNATLGWSPEPGESMVCDVRQSIDIVQSFAGQEDEEFQRLEHFARLSLEAGEKRDDGTVLVEISVEVLAIAGEAGGSSMVFVGAREESFLEEVGPLVANSSSEGLSALAGALLDSTITIGVTPEGSVRGASGLDGFLQAYAGQNELDESVLGFFTPSKLGEILGPLFDADGARTRNPQVGKGWETTRRVELDAAGAFEMTNSWRVASSVAGVTTLEGEVSIDLLLPRFRSDATPEVVLGDYDGSTSSTWDVSTGRLIRREGTMDIDTVWTLSELKITQRQKSRSLIEAVARE